MNMLIVSNLYPPFHSGGYEIACADVARAMVSRGHRVRILTGSRGGHVVETGEMEVHRVLDWCYPPDPNWLRERRRNMRNRDVFARQIEAARPDVVLVFNPSGLGRMALSALHEQRQVPVVHEIADFWLPNATAEDTWLGFARREARNRLVDGLKRMVVDSGFAGPWKPVPLDLEHSYFRSRFLRDWFVAKGLSTGKEPVIHHGIAAGSVPVREPSANGILHMGRMCREKGTDVLLRALAGIARRGLVGDARITFAGGCEDAFQDEFAAGIEALRAHAAVDVTGMLPRGKALELFRSHSILAFPVVWDEPFGLVPLEAMAAGLAVVATGTGGSGEFCRHDENCLLVPPGDSDALGGALARLLGDESLRLRLGREGSATADSLSADKAMDAVERHLLQVAAR